MILTYSGANLTPYTTSLCGAYSLAILVLADCFGPTLVMAVGYPEDTLVATPEAVASVHSPITTIGAVSYPLIIPNPSALTCQDFKERSNHVVLI